MFVFLSAPRWKAFGIHLAFSLIVLTIILLVLILVWYPSLFINAGGWQGIRIVTGVDLVLGPLITLIIYNPKKKHLFWDMTAVIIFQINCLAVGVYFVYTQKPDFLVLSDEGMHTLHHADISRYSINKNDLPDTEALYGIPLFVRDLPKENAQAVKSISAILEGKPFYAEAEFLLPFDWALEQTQRYLPEISLIPEPRCYPVRILSEHKNFQACLTKDLHLLPAPSEPISQP